MRAHGLRPASLPLQVRAAGLELAVEESSEDGLLNVNQMPLVGALVNSVKELKARQEASVKELKAEMKARLEQQEAIVKELKAEMKARSEQQDAVIRQQAALIAELTKRLGIAVDEGAAEVK